MPKSSVPKSRPDGGRPVVFPHRSTKVVGLLSQVGVAGLAVAKTALRALCLEVLGWAPSHISDGDALEYLALGPAKARKVLKARR